MNGTNGVNGAKDTNGPAASAWWAPEAAFFGPLYLEADDSYHTFFADSADLDTRTAREVDGVERLCRLRPGMRVVDCPCGYGRHTIELARRGYRVTGVDLNPTYLGLARERAAGASVTVDLRRGDMRELAELPDLGPADALVNMFYSFGFFDQADDDLRVLEGFRGRLADGGRLLVHTMITVPAFADGRIPAEEVRELRSGRRLRSVRRFDRVSRREVGTWSILTPDGGEQRLPTYSVRIYLPDELAELCYKAGFSDVRFYGDWDASPYHDQAPYLITVAEA